jgi:hypothetical protein
MASSQLPTLLPLRKKTDMACTNCRESKVRVSVRFHHLSNIIGSTPQCARHPVFTELCGRCVQRNLECRFEKKTPSSANCYPAPTANMGVNQGGYVYPASSSGMLPTEFNHYGESSISAANQPTVQSHASMESAWYYQQTYSCDTCGGLECICPFQFCT